MKNCDRHQEGNSLLGLDTPQIWSTELAFEQLRKIGKADTKRTTERRLHELGIVPIALTLDSLVDAMGNKPISSVLQSQITQARGKRHLVLFAQLATLPTGRPCLHFNDARGARYWFPLSRKVNRQTITEGLSQLQQYTGKEITIFPHGELIEHCRHFSSTNSIHINTLAYPLPFKLSAQNRKPADANRHLPPHLKQLEAESIHIIREAVAEAENPALLYSLGKDSSVLLHLARKAFYPAKPPLPLLHVDTRWKFRDMYLFRDHIAQTSGLELHVHVNPEAIEKNINPFDHGSTLHTDITKTQALKQALDHYKFDLVFGGARRDEEKSRAKERIFSLRSPQHRWEPKSQRPELWNLYNTRKLHGSSLRVFPLSNWTELDVWQYIWHENIPVVPLYFASERPVVVRNGTILMVDDERMPLLDGETIESKLVRFRTLGCYPLTGAIESHAGTVEDIIIELLNTRHSERQGRAIDKDSSSSMEKKKQEGYF